MPEGKIAALSPVGSSRAGKHPKKFLSRFRGYLPAEGYCGYDQLPNVTIAGCWARARRKFDEALKVPPPDKRASPTVAPEGLSFCNRLFEIERELAEATPEERYTARLEKSVPVLNKFWEWLEKLSSQVLPQTVLGQAIKYCHSQRDKLQNFLRDGRLEIHNRCEHSIKPFVIGRKGSLSCNTPKRARASA